MVSDIFEKLIPAGGGALVSLSVAYVIVSRDLAFIKGQLSQIMDAIKDIQRLRETQIVISKDQERTRKDVDAAHERIRELTQGSIQ